MPDPIWIVSVALLWAVVGLLCLVVLSLLRQVGALRRRLDLEGDRRPGLALGDGPPARTVRALDGRPVVLGGPRDRPLLIVRIGPRPAALMDALATLSALSEPDGADGVAVVDRPGTAPAASDVPIVAYDTLPPGLLPAAPGGAVALGLDGALAARGHPHTPGDLNEMAAAARQAGWSAGGVRERDWGESVPSW